MICICMNGECVKVDNPETDLTAEDCMKCPYLRTLSDKEAREFIAWANEVYGNDSNRKN